MHSKSTIRKAELQDLEFIHRIAIQSFKESHGHSASEEDIENYISRAFTKAKLREEFNDSSSLFHLITYERNPCGYSKIRLDSPHESMSHLRAAKLERLYLLASHHGLGLGHRLMEQCIKIARTNNQNGIWLYVWKENVQAIKFYSKAGFEIIGEYDFEISVTHSNPNHRMLKLL